MLFFLVAPNSAAVECNYLVTGICKNDLLLIFLSSSVPDKTDQSWHQWISPILWVALYSRSIWFVLLPLPAVLLSVCVSGVVFSAVTAFSTSVIVFLIMKKRQGKQDPKKTTSIYAPPVYNTITETTVKEKIELTGNVANEHVNLWPLYAYCMPFVCWCKIASQKERVLCMMYLHSLSLVLFSLPFTEQVMKHYTFFTV